MCSHDNGITEESERDFHFAIFAFENVFSASRLSCRSSIQVSTAKDIERSLTAGFKTDETGVVVFRFIIRTARWFDLFIVYPGMFVKEKKDGRLTLRKPSFNDSFRHQRRD